MAEWLLNAAMLVAILGGSAILTQWFTRRMYYRCTSCATLNAKRRAACRQCGRPLL